MKIGYDVLCYPSVSQCNYFQIFFKAMCVLVLGQVGRPENITIEKNYAVIK